jgi:hypothetical protein
MGASRLYRLATPFNVRDLGEISYDQTADVLYLAHLDYAPGKMSRLDHANWLYTTLTFGPTITAPTGVTVTATSPNPADSALRSGTKQAFWPIQQSYVVTAVKGRQQSRASAAASVSNDLTLAGNYNSISWTAVSGAERYNIYKDEAASGVFGYIGATTGTSFKDGSPAINQDKTDTPPQGSNLFSGAGNYPSVVTFFEQRLCFARTRNNPNAVWMSNSADFENFDIRTPSKADDAIALALVAGGVQAVQSLVPTSELLALTNSAVWRMATNGEPLYATKPPTLRRQLGRGASRLRPLTIDEVTFFQPARGASVRSIGFSFEVDGYKSSDVTIFSPHLFQGFTIKWWAYAQEPASVIWAGRSDGKLLAFTWQQEQQVWGWTLCELANGGVAESGCVIPEEGEDRLYMIVLRTLNGRTLRVIERMERFSANTMDACYLDCARTFQFPTPQTVVGQLWHLEGEAVSALADGEAIMGLTVQNGQVTLPQAATNVTVGLPYEALIETLPPAIAAEGTSQGKRQTTGTVVVRMDSTRGIEVGSSEQAIFPVKFRTDELLGQPTRLFSGDKEVQVAATWSRGGSIIIRQRQPLPMTVLGVFVDPVITA